MSKIDEKIRTALHAETGGGREGEEGSNAEPQLRQLVGDMFYGRLRWLNMFGYVLTMIFIGLGILSAIRFFQAEEPRPMLAWAIAFVICIMMIGMLKIWFFLELQKSSILREIKRLELQVAQLAARADSGE